MKKLLLTSIFGFAFILLFKTTAFTQERCGTTSYNTILTNKYPELKLQFEENENLLQKTVREIKSGQKTTTIYTIPVVFHVLWNSWDDYISEAQIFSQLEVINKDFRKLNADASNVPPGWQSSSADAEFEFCLAAISPGGIPTTGIIYKQTNKTQFDKSTDDAKFNSTGGDNIWNRNNYLNVWVVPDITDNTLGYSSFPGAPANVDGIVIKNSALGTNGTAAFPFHLGRTLTHELGHWFSLFHIWGDDELSPFRCVGSDFCNDTPNQLIATYNCPVFPLTDSCSSSPPGIMFMNFMDYVNDSCMNLFTNDQKVRMQAVMLTVRSTLQNTNKCCPGSLNLSGINSSSNYLAYKAANSITSSVENQANSDFDYKAGNLIVLQPGFKALYGCTFVAYLGSCNGYRMVTPENHPADLPNAGETFTVFPNPFTANTTIKYELSHDVNVSILIYNMQMQIVDKVLTGDIQSKGIHTIDYENKNLNDGIYFCKLQHGDIMNVIKMIVHH